MRAMVEMNEKKMVVRQFRGMNQRLGLSIKIMTSSGCMSCAGRMENVRWTTSSCGSWASARSRCVGGEDVCFVFVIRLCIDIMEL